MEERQLKNIKRYLQNEDVQERIKQYMQRGRSEATVSIGRVAQLFQLKESKLRDWETRGLLKPLRSKDITGQRQYSPSELDKLAILKELVDEGGYAPSDIPPDIDSIWYSISRSDGQQDQALKFNMAQVDYAHEADHMPIDRRINHRYHQELFWRYYASHALRLSLMLICEENTFTRAGLILPLHKKDAFALIHQPENLPEVGESLVGWLGQSLSFYTFLTPTPSFEYPRDFHILPLQAVEEGIPKEDKPKDDTLLIVPRMEADARPITLIEPVVETIRRLLSPLYDEVPDWHFYLGRGMRDMLDPLIDFNSGTKLPDVILTGIAERVVHLGGRNREGENRWRFCCILVPNNSNLPLQQRSLVVRAQSKLSPHKIGVTSISPDKYVNSPSLRAYQSGHVIYRAKISATDTSIAHRDVEGPIRSVLALSIGGENGEPVAVLYIASHCEDSFLLEDQHMLRMIGRIVEEVLTTYHDRQHVIDNLGQMLEEPSLIDRFFKDFRAEDQLISDLEKILTDIKDGIEEPRLTEKVISFITVDVDNQSILSNRYGDRVTRNLSREVGLRIRAELRAFKEHPELDRQLYHIYADRFYVLLKDMPLEQAQEKARSLIEQLRRPYRVDALRVSLEQPVRTASMLVLNEITVRLGVLSFTYTKLADLLQRYSIGSSVIEVREIITLELENSLEKGKDEGGNVVITWNPQIRGFERLLTQKEFE